MSRGVMAVALVAIAALTVGIAVAVMTGCSPTERREAQSVVDVALDRAEGACVVVHDRDVDAGPVIVAFCRNEGTLQTIADEGFTIAGEVADGGVMAIDPHAVAAAFSSIEHSTTGAQVLADAGKQ